MKKHFLVLVILLAIIPAAQAQFARLWLSIPAFRVGEKAEISYNLYSDTTGYADSQKGEGSIKLENTFKKPGPYSIGPISLTIDGITYRSDKITVQVDEALPEENNCIWIRQVKFDGDEYILIEQRIGGDWETVSTGSNSSNTSFRSKSEDFAEIDPGKLNDAPVNLQFHYSFSTTQNLGNGESANYKISVYVLTKTDRFPGSFTLTRKHMKDLDAKTSFTNFIIH